MTTSGSSRHVLLVGTAVLLGCMPMIATAQVSGGVPAAERECALAHEPEAAPPVSAVADSATLMTSLSRLHPDVLARRYGVYSVRFDAGGAMQWITQLATNFPEEYQDTVSVTLSRHLNQTDGGERGVRLALTLGPDAELVVGPPLLCPPVEMRERPRRIDMRTEVMTGDDFEDLRRAGRALVRVRVSPSGQVLRATLLRSSGSSIKDDWALEAIEETGYAPALQDGVPVRGTLVVEWGDRTTGSF